LNVGQRAISANIGENCALVKNIPMDDDDESEFATLLTGVKRLRNDKINVYQQRKRQSFSPRAQAEKVPLETAAFSASALALSAHFNTGLQKKLQRRIRQGQIRPEASLDLHGMRQQEALQALDSFLGNALGSGMRMLIVVHGQGYRSQSDAVLKPLVQRWLANQPQVLGWCPAQPRDGAAGASYVYLRVE